MTTHTFEVDGHKYDFDAFGALEATQILGRVYGILGDGLKTAGNSDGAGVLVAIVGGLMSNLGDDRTVEIIKEFAKKSRLHDPGTEPLELSGNNMQNFNVHFERRTVALGKWFVACFSFQFADFLYYVRDTVLLRLVALEQLLLRSLQTSTGSSGASSPASESQTANSPSSESGA